jgi:hypothetical protein
MEVANLVALLLRALLVVVALIVTDSTAFAQATATPTPTRTAAATPIPCSTAPAGVVIMLENPSPGDTLLTGTQLVMNGIAFDTRSTSGPGIALVTIYLGPRDAGGVSLGTATLGQPNPSVPAGSPLSTAGFTLRSSALPGGSGPRSLFVYARALQDNTEGVLEVPIFLNSAPTPVRGQVPTAVVPTPVPCTPTPVATNTPVPPTNAPVSAATSTPVIAATPTPINVVAPLPPAPVAPAPAAPAAQVATPAPVVAVAPTTAQTAPRGGGIPSEVGLGLVVLGAAIAGAALTLRRRR